MSPQAGNVLLEEITPRLRQAIPHAVGKVGIDDAEELVQDAIAVAAKMLHDLERRGKSVTPGNVAYYTILNIKSGRRSTGTGRTDVMMPGTQLDGTSCVLSLEDEVGYDPELDEPIRLGEMLADSADDPSMEGARNLDWESFLQSRDYRYRVIVQGIVEGKTTLATAKECGEKYRHVRELRVKLAADVREFMGPDAMANCLRTPAWKGNVTVDREKAACRADRRRP
jgi:hypothetical protein